MKHVPLKEYEEPRILLVDFSENDVRKLAAHGFAVRRGYSGLYDNNEFCIPCAMQDVEICIIKIGPNTFKGIDTRHKNEASFSEEFYLHALLEETWNRTGWSVIFINEGTPPTDLEYLGIKYLGLFFNNGRYFSGRSGLKRSTGVEVKFPKFTGEAVKSNGVLGDLLLRYSNHAKLILMAMDKEIAFFSNTYDQIWALTDGSAQPKALAISLQEKFVVKPKVINMPTVDRRVQVELPDYAFRGIIILPDFGDKNIEVAHDIIQETIYRANPWLFSKPRHEWLADCRPKPVEELKKKIAEKEASLKADIEEINKKIQEEEEHYKWLDLLLVGEEDEFKDAAKRAFEFIGFRVEDIDSKLKKDERKREDLNIRNPETATFYLGEAKTTKRGANEDFITKTQGHQANYSREHNCAIPKAILIINHSIDLEPEKRKARFYKDSEVIERLKEQQIMALDSVLLHSLSQRILGGQIRKEEGRRLIENISGVYREG